MPRFHHLLTILESTKQAWTVASLSWLLRSDALADDATSRFRHDTETLSTRPLRLRHCCSREPSAGAEHVRLIIWLTLGQMQEVMGLSRV